MQRIAVLLAGSAVLPGMLYGRVGLSDLTRTSDSPDPIGPAIPMFTSALGITWSRALGRSVVGATVAYHETRLDVAHAARWTLDVGASRDLGAGGTVRLAVATHFVSSLSVKDPAQDLYAGIEARLWQGPLWGGRAAVRGRYGLAFGHGFGADHQLGVGLDLGGVVGLDGGVVREGSYGSVGWRPVAGVARRGVPAAPARAGRPAGVAGRHRKVLVEARRRRGDRVGPDPGGQAAHPVHLVAGGVRSGVRVLRHGADGIPAQSVGGRDRRAGARAAAARSGAQAQQRRLHGDGRAAPQLGRRG